MIVSKASASSTVDFWYVHGEAISDKNSTFGYFKEYINGIAPAVGVPLFMDKAAEEVTRIGFARVFVEVNCSDTLPDVVEVFQMLLRLMQRK